MKFKKLLSVVGLGLFAVVSVGAGVALAKSPEAKAAKADDPKTWMMRFQFNAGNASQTYPAPFDNRVNGMKFRCWGADFVYETEAEKMFTWAYQDYYGVNVSFTDSQVVTGAQWVMHRDDYADSSSVDINEFGTSGNTSLDKNTTYKVIGWQFGNAWQGDKFDYYTIYGSQVSTELKLEWQGGGSGSMIPDPVNNVFKFEGFIADNDHKWISVTAGNDVTLRERIAVMLTEDSLKYVTGSSENPMYLAANGYYSVYLRNGSVQIKKSGTESSYVYFVSQTAAQDSNLFAYTFGVDEAHGTFPGTKVDNPTWTEGVTFVEPAYGFKFQNQDHKVYRISIEFSDFDKDNHIIFSDGTTQSENLLIQPGAAYWMGSAAESFNRVAGKVLDLFYDLQAALLDADPYDPTYSETPLQLARSVCALDSTTSGQLYARYDEFTDAEKLNYINCSQIKTYTGVGDNQDYRSATEVFYRLARQAGIDPEGTGRIINEIIGINDSTGMIIASVVVIVSIASVAVLFVIKKRKHE